MACLVLKRIIIDNHKKWEMCNKKLKIIDITHARLNELGDGKKVVTECLAIIIRDMVKV